MKADEKKVFGKKIGVGACIDAILFLAFILIANLTGINQWLGGVLLLLRPILIGLALAYICNPFFRFFERKLLYKLHPPTLRRVLSLILTYLTFLLIIALVLLLILPQFIESIAAFAEKYDSYVNTAIAQLNRTIDKINEITERFLNSQLLQNISAEEIRANASKFFGGRGKNLLDYIKEMNIKPLTDMISNVITVLRDTLFGFFISIYLLSTKEKRYAQIMKLRRALFSDNVNATLTRLFTIADRSFGGFLEGKLLDSLIIGILTYVVISFFGIPYAILIATFVGITNIVPVIGPFIGAIPTAFILLLSDPSKIIPFLIIILVIQQLDGNIIGPKILGDNTGVSPLCVIIAVATVGSLWGIVGMIVGVPLFATILEMTDSFVVSRLQKKGMPSGVENYYASDSLVDPTKNAHPTTDKTARYILKRAVQIRKKKENSEALRRSERLLLALFHFLNKYHLITEMSDEAQAAFASEMANKAAEAEAEAFLAAHRAEREATVVEAPAETEDLSKNAEELTTDAQAESVTEEERSTNGSH